MPRNKLDLEKVTLRLFTGDKSRLEDYYPTVGYNAIVRKLVHAHLKKLDERVNLKQSEQENSDDLDIHIEL